MSAPITNKPPLATPDQNRKTAKPENHVVAAISAVVATLATRAVRKARRRPEVRGTKPAARAPTR